MNEDVKVVFEKLEKELVDAPEEAEFALKCAEFKAEGCSIQYSLLKNNTKMVSIIVPEHTVTARFSLNNELTWSNRPTEVASAFRLVREKMFHSVNNEAFYDAEIAPVLAQLARKCQARGMAFVAAVDNREAEGGGTYNTLLPSNDMSVAMHLNYMALRSVGNVDTLMFSVIKHAERVGHSSVYLNIIQSSIDKAK